MAKTTKETDAKHDEPNDIAPPPGCDANNEVSDAEIVDFEVGQYRRGRITDIKAVKTKEMKKENFLITFDDDKEGKIKFWSCGHLNNFLESHPDFREYSLTLQRIEDQDFKKGRGRAFRVYIHAD